MRDSGLLAHTCVNVHVLRLEVHINTPQVKVTHTKLRVFMKLVTFRSRTE